MVGWSDVEWWATEFWGRLTWFLELFIGSYGPHVQAALVSLALSLVYAIFRWYSQSKVKQALALAVYVVLMASYLIWRLVVAGVIETSVGDRSLTDPGTPLPLTAWVILIMVATVALAVVPFLYTAYAMHAYLVQGVIVAVSFALDYFMAGWNPFADVTHAVLLTVVVVFVAVWMVVSVMADRAAG